MLSTKRTLGIILCLVSLTACGTTRRYVDQPRLSVEEPEENVREAVGELFGSATPYTVKLCEAEQASKECKSGSQGITATGVGGLFVPLTLHVKGLVVRQENQSDDGVAFDVSLESVVDAVAPVCSSSRVKIVSRDNQTAALQFGHFYCNWLVLGNVLVSAELSIDSINLRDKVFTGFYKMSFHGTGNAAGSGYYKAVVAPRGTEVLGRSETTEGSSMRPHSTTSSLADVAAGERKFVATLN